MLTLHQILLSLLSAPFILMGLVALLILFNIIFQVPIFWSIRIWVRTYIRINVNDGDFDLYIYTKIK